MSISSKTASSKTPLIQWKKLPKLQKTPKISICTPTYNRRPFIPFIMKCVMHQTYPLNRIEWIVVDDGTDCVKDLFDEFIANAGTIASNICVKYIGPEIIGEGIKLTLGEKRNMTHKYATGDVIVYMDDDDYYPPERISHAVKMLQNNPKAWISGSSELHIYFKHINKMFQFGPYGPKHATAASFAFRRELLEQTSYQNEACLAEERHFLQNNTIPFVQLDVRKTILVFSHNHNSFDKKQSLNDPANSMFIKPSMYSVDDFIKQPDLKQFYMIDIEQCLENYHPGELKNKQDVLKQLEEMRINRLKKSSEFYINAQKEAHTNLQIQSVIQTIMSVKPYKQKEESSIVKVSNDKQELDKKIKYYQSKLIELGETPQIISTKDKDNDNDNDNDTNEMLNRYMYMQHLENQLKNKIQEKIREKNKK